MNPRRFPHSIRRGCASRAVIGTLRPTERRRATLPSGLTESLHWNSTSYRKRPATESSVGTTDIQVACQNGAEGARTPDLLGAIQALSQLSYSPAIAGTGERGGSLAPGPPDDNSPAHFAGPRSSCLMITAFAPRVKRTPSHLGVQALTHCAGKRCLHAHGSRRFSIPTNKSDGGRSHDFRRFPNCPHSPRSCPPTASPCRAPATARVGQKMTPLRTRPIKAVPGNIRWVCEHAARLASTETRP
jgi:hypothetical protein